MTAPIFDEAAMRVIRATPPFRQADERMLARLTAGGVVLSLARGRTLYIEGDEAAALFVSCPAR